MEMLKQSTTLAVVGQLDAASSTDQLTAITKSYNVAVEDTSQIVDKLVAVDLNYAASTGEISTALQKVASSAGQAGLGLDKLIGLITISEEKTRQAPEVIGSAWQSIIARIGKITAKVDLDDLVDENGKVVATINDADKVLSKYGINLVDTSGKMRDMGTIMDEIGAKWGQMSTLEQNQLAYVVAGVRQRNVFIAAMEDYNKVLEATEVSQNANGVAAEKMTVYNESLEAAQNRLTASVQQFAQDSNLDRTLALAYDGLSKVVEILNILLNKIPVLSPLIKALGVALAAAFIKSTIEKAKETGNVIDNLIKLLTGTQQQVKATTGLIPTLSAAFTGLTGVINGTTTASAALGAVWTAMGGWVGVAIAAIGALVALLPSAVRWFNNLKNAKENALKQSSQELDKANKNLEETNGQIKEIQDKIREINSKGNLTIADEAEKQRLQDQLDVLKEIQKTQEAIAKEKAETNAQDLEDVVKSRYSGGKTSSEYLEKLTKDAAGYKAQGQDPYASMYDAESASVQQLIANLKFLDEQKKNLKSTDSDYQEQLDRINQLYSENNTQLLTQKTSLLNYKQELIDAGKEGSEAFKIVTERLSEIDILLDPSNFKDVKIDELIDTTGVKGKLQKASSEAKDALTKAASDTSIAVQKQAVDASKNLSDTIKTSAEEIANKIKTDKELKSMFAEVFNIDPAEFDKNINEVTAVIEQKLAQAYGVAADAASNAESSVRNANGEIKTAAELADELGQRETDLATKTDALSNAYNAMIDKGKLTKAQMNALIKQYPELTSAIEVHNGVIRIETSVLQDKYDTVMQGEIAYYNAQIRETDIAIQETTTRITAYENEANALRTLNRLQPTQKQKDFESSFPGVKFYGSMDGFPDLKGAADARADLYKQDKEDLVDLNAQLEVYRKNVQALSGQHLEYSGSGSSGKKSGKSAADKAAKEFESAIKEKIQNLKSIVELYSENANWDDPTVIKEFQDRYDKILNEVINDPKARKVLADAFNLDISNMPVEQQIQELTTLWQKQAGTIQESYQKLLKNLAKEDLSSAKAVIEKYKNGIYGAWSSDEALNAAKADYQKFIDKITNDADYRAAMAEALNLGDISGEPVEKQIEAVTSALLKSTGTLDDAQQDLYDDASKNIKALQDEIEDMIDTAIDLLEKAGDFLFDMLGKISDRYDAQIDNLDKISDELDDQKDAFEDKIDKQKELLKLQKEEMDNADELAEKNKSIADIDAQLMELQYDNSAEAQAKRLKLLDERAEKEKDLADWQKDNDYNTKIDALDKEKSEYEKIIEAEKKAIEAQKQTLQDAQKQFETTLGNIKNGFDTFIKILSSDLVKNLISKALIGTGQDTVTNLLTGYNKIFGSGIDTDVTGIISKAYKSVGDIGGKLVNSFNLDGVGSTIGDMLNGITKNFGNFANGISQVIQPGIQSVSGIFNGLGNTLKGAFNLDWNGIVSTMGSGLQTITTTFSSLFSPIAKGASAIGDAIGAGITGFFPGIFTALGTLVSTVGTAMGGVLDAIATAMASIPVVGWVIAAAAVAGAIALVASIASIVSKTKSSKVSQPTQSFTAKKHHTGADYVKKENPALDKMLGLNDDETVSILHVGEAVVPTWANNATSSASSNRFTGSPFGSAVDTAVKSARANTRTYSSSDNSTVNISMPINIQGNADTATVNSLRKEADNIVNRVLKKINSQTKIGGYKNIKAATV